MIIEYRMRAAFLRNLLTQSLHGRVSAVSTKTNAGFVHSLCNPPIISTRSAHSCIWVISEFWQLITNSRIVFASNKRIPPALQAFSHLHPLSPPCLIFLHCFFKFLIICFYVSFSVKSRRRRVSHILMFSERPRPDRGLASAREAARQRLRCAAAECLAKPFFGLR